MTKLQKKGMLPLIRSADTFGVRFIMHPPGKRSTEGILYLRVTVNGHRAPERSTNIRVKPDDWDSTAQRIKGKGRATAFKNETLVTLISDITAIYYDLKNRPDPVTARKVLSAAFNQGEHRVTFEGLFKRHIRDKKNGGYELNKATIEIYQRYFKNIDTFLSARGLKNALLEDFKESHITEFFEHLQRKGFKATYIRKQTSFLKAMFNYAEKRGLLHRSPFSLVRIASYEDPDTTSLSQSEVKRILLYDFTNHNLPAERLRLLDEERDSFIFCCYTGLHHSDYTSGMAGIESLRNQVTKKDIYFLIGYRVKSAGGQRDKTYSVPLIQIVLDILQKYGGLEKMPKRGNAKRNLVLKEIAAYVGININLTTKIARKTFASFCLNDKAMRPEVVSKMMGQKSARYLSHYATINDQSIYKDFVRDNENFEENIEFV